MKPSPAWMLAIISAATTISQVSPMPTAMPVKIDGAVAGSTILQKRCHGRAPIDSAARW